MAQRFIISDGATSKAVSLWGDEGWTIYSGGEITECGKIYQAVPWVYRGVNLVADGLADLPWVLYKGETEFDTSAHYENKLGWIDNPSELFQQIARSLQINGRAYLLKERSKAGIKRLIYLAPETIQADVDKKTGNVTFVRSINGQRIPLTTDDVIYFWLPDPSVEKGPPASWPVLAAQKSANVLVSLDDMVAGYFRRGMIRPTFFAVEGNPRPEDREKLESWFNRVATGVRNAFRVLFLNLQKISPVTLGDGLDQLSDTTLTTEARQSIATALGIPYAILFSEAANFATMAGDYRTLYNNTIVPLASFVAHVLNSQLFIPAGFRLEFQPEGLEIYQADEADRAGALQQLTSAGVPLLDAMDILGYDLTDEQRASIEGHLVPPPAQAPSIAPVAPLALPEPAKAAELRAWKNKALHYLERGKPAHGPFEATAIPADECNRIRRALTDCHSAEHVRAVFDSLGPVDLATELRRANDMLERLTA